MWQATNLSGKLTAMIDKVFLFLGNSSTDCGAAVGIEMGTIADAQFTASTTWYGKHAYRARLNNYRQDGASAWVANIADEHQFLQVDLLRVYELSELAVQGGGSACDCYTSAFRLLYSLDGLVWTFYDSGRIVQGNTERYRTLTHTFPSPIKARFFAIQPTSWYYRPALRIELYGCSRNNTIVTQTNVTSDIMTNQYWDLAGSPYVLHQTIKVAYAAKLTIQAGVDVVFVGRQTGLTVEGCLKVQGMSGLDISFHSNSIHNYLGQGTAYWKGIEIKRQACSDLEFTHTRIFGADTAVSSAATKLLFQNVTIEYNVRGLRTSGDDSTKLRIEDSHFDSNSQEGIYAQAHGEVVILRSVFKYNYYGVRTNDLLRVEINDCSFANRIYGFAAYDIRSDVQIHNTNFSDLNRGIYLSLLSHTEVTHIITVQNCTFSGHTDRSDEGLYMYIYGAYTVNAANCLFHDNTRGITVHGDYNSKGSVLFENITMLRNTQDAITITNNYIQIGVRGSTFSENRGRALSVSNNRETGRLMVTKCLFVANAGYHVVRINEHGPHSIIENNTFVNNTASTTLVVQDSRQRTLACINNAFSNPQAKHELTVETTWADSYAINASYNWWGTTNTSLLHSRIKDFFLDMTRAEALLSPIYEDPTMDSTKSVNITTDFGFGEGKLGGRLIEDTMLSPDNITTVEFTIHVPRGKNLTIRSNGTFEFLQDGGIFVQGGLTIRGETDSSLVFTAVDGATSWRGLELHHSSDAVLEKFVIKKANTGIKTQDASLSLDSCVIENCVAHGIDTLLAVNQTLYVHSCSVVNNRQHGLFARSGSSSGNYKVEIDNCTFISNRNYGVLIDSGDVRLRMTDCRLNNNYRNLKAAPYSGVVEIHGCFIGQNEYRWNMWTAQVSMRSYSDVKKKIITVTDSNFVFSGRTQGLYVDSHSAGVSDNVRIAGNKFSSSRQCLRIENTRRMWLDDNSFASTADTAVYISQSRVDDIRIRNNTFHASEQALSVSLRYGAPNDALKIANNRFLDNTAGPVVKLEFGSYKATSYVQGNIFQNNTGNTAAMVYVVNNAATSTESVTIVDNFFDNPSAAYDIKVKIPYAEGHTMYAIRNWWGGKSTSHVQSRIFDHSSDSTMAVVAYEPYRLTRETDALSQTANVFIRRDGTVGGIVNEDTFLEKEHSPYVVEEDIFVPVGVTLTVEAGAELLFQRGGITVEGTLQLLGEEDDQVVLQPRSGGSFKGIRFQERWSDEVRLRGGISAREGRIELIMNEKWVALSNYYWNKNGADVVCRQLGYINGAEEVVTTRRFGTDSNVPISYRASCSGQTTLQECGLYTAVSSVAAGVVCRPNALDIENSNVYLQGYGVDTFVGFDETKSAIMSHNSTLFTLVRPGLTQEAGTVSIMSFEKPGWYLRHYNGRVYLEPKVNHRNPVSFDGDATFSERADMFFDGFTAFESVTNPGHYIAHNETEGIYIRRWNGTSDIEESASFVVMSSPSGRRKRAAAVGEIEDDGSGFEEYSGSGDDISTTTQQTIPQTTTTPVPMVTVSASVMNHVTVTKSTEGVTVEGRPPTMNHVTVYNSSANGITFDSFLRGEFALHNCSVLGSKGRGIFFRSRALLFNARVTLDACTVEDNAGEGIEVINYVNITVVGSSIRRNAKSGCLFHDRSRSNTDGAMIFHRNTISENGQYGLKSQGATSVSIKNNEFSRNSIGARSAYSTLYFNDCRLGVIEISNNSFTDNRNYYTYYSWGRYVRLAYTMYIGSASDIKLQVTRNTFLNNSGGGVIHISTASSSVSGEIGDNVFRNNLRVLNENMYTVHLTSSFAVSLANNVFDNPNTNHEIRVPTFKEGQTVNATGCYWGVTSYGDVISRTVSFFTNMDLAMIDVWPFRKSGDKDTSLVLPPEDYGFFSKNIGGVVRGKLNVTERDQPYIVRRSIYVEGEGVLDIAPGVNLQFEPGRGIKVKGALTLRGTDEQPISLNSTSNAKWYGVIFGKESTTDSISCLSLDSTEHGLAIYQDDVEVSNCTISGSNIGLSINSRGKVNVERCVFTRNVNAVKWSDSSVTLGFLGCEFRNNNAGIRGRYTAGLMVSDCRFVANSNLAFRIESSYNPSGAVTIQNNLFQRNYVSIHVDAGYPNVTHIRGNTFQNDTNGAVMKVYVYDTNMVVESNTFVDLPRGAMMVHFYRRNAKHTIICNNTYHGITGIPVSILSADYSNVTVEKNVFSNNALSEGTAGVNMEYTYGISGRIRLNEFRNNIGQNIIKINVGRHLSSSSKQLDIESNIFFDNVASQAVLVTNTHLCLMTGNMFSNVLSSFDVLVTFTSSNLSAPRNWWGSPDDDHVTNRIWDESDDPNVGRVLYEPFLLESKMPCDEVANCTGHGRCVRPNTCECQSGWAGADCSLFTCVHTGDCQDRGACVGPNMCDCEDGWLAPDCVHASCYERNNCSDGHGICVGPNRCHCAEQFSGASCESCAGNRWGPDCELCPDCEHGECNRNTGRCDCENGWLLPVCAIASCYDVNNCSGHGLCVTPDRCSCAEHYTGSACDVCTDNRWGPECLPCPSCVNGVCDINTGKCVCDAVNWTGALCDKCSETFYGPSCLPLLKVLQVAPDTGPDTGGTNVHVLGHNFPNSSEYKCRFDDETVPGTWLSSTEVLCWSPQHATGRVYVEIKPSSEETFSNDQTTFNYYALCPESACGSLKTPRRGVCSMGRCLCSIPWLGNDCEILGLAPKITQISLQTVVEGSPFNMVMTTSEGTTPLTWRLITAPPDMAVGVADGVITWTAVARGMPYNVTVKASNSVGFDQITFTVVVHPSYKIVLDPVSSGPFLRASSVMISGRVVFLVNNSSLASTDVPVTITIKSAAGVRTIQTTTRYGSDIFYKRFYPYSSETGLFEVDAGHPADEDFDAQLSWTVYGLTIRSSPQSLSGYLDTYHLSLTIRNTGVDLLTGLVIQKVNAPFRIMLSEKENSQTCLLHLTDCPFATQLEPASQVRLNITFIVDRPVRGFFRFAVTSKQGVTRFVDLQGNFRRRMPQFAMTPNSISASLTRGRQYTFVVNVTNVGLRPATGVRVELPDEPLLSLVSFGNTAEDNEGDATLTLAPGASAILVLSASTSEREPLSRRTGTLVVRSLQIDASVSYSFVLVSSDKLDLTVRVEDEFTYFADSRPLLAGAKVTLRSRLRSVSITRYTNESGIAVFSNIKEDYYSLYTSATKHIGDTRVILATPSDNDVRVFLQRTAVTYSWVVKRVTFEDEYKVTLEATFETHVPMPVVTITPIELDMEVLHRGLMPVINFELTNHGLIRAEDVTFRLPASNSHPFMHFEMNEGELGSIEANTTMFIPVRVVIDEAKKQSYITEHGGIKKRSNTLACLALAFYAGYTYLCDRARFNELQVPIRNLMNDLDCGGGSGGGSSHYWYSGTGPVGGKKTHGGVVVPVTTELTCKQLQTCIEGALGCVSPVASIIFCIRDIATLSPPFTIIKVGRVAIGCALLAAPPVFGCIWSMSMCLVDLATGGSRRRRSLLTKDDIAPELIKRTVAAANYGSLARMVFNDDKWFEVNDLEWWDTIIQPTMADNSDGGKFITPAEYDIIRTFPLPVNATWVMVDRLIVRFNSTHYNWDHGTLTGENMVSYTEFNTLAKRIETDIETAKQDGFSSLADWYEDASKSYKKAQKSDDSGVCAVVRIRIQQRLAITRDAFEATLELENGESDRLAGIRVVVTIVDHTTKENAQYKFAIGKAEVSGMGSVDGNGVLEMGVAGTATWLIIPYSEAAPTDDVQYDIGGTLYYTVNGENITVPLFPETITVTPDPRLYLNYFLERNVRSDDPMTKDVIEPTIPYTLGLLITNDGYGPARNTRITSGQPEIIENEKGLLITFKIIGAQVDDQPVAPSLTVTFGDIQAMTTRVSRWLMTSTLKGTFSNYTATFENVNPLGDPQLSVMESVLFHELLHVVRIDVPEDDGLIDFLVYSENKVDLLPDRIYQSTDGRHPLNVTSCNDTSIEYVSSSRIQVHVSPDQSGWVYFRCVYAGDEDINPVSVVRSDTGRSINVEYNLWIDQIDDDWYLQLIDYIDTAGVSVTYDVTLARLNKYSPRFEQAELRVNVSEDMRGGMIVLQPNATDNDPGQIVTYMIKNVNSAIVLPFGINSTSGAVRFSGELDREDVSSYTFSVIASDDGTPSRSSAVAVLVSLLDVNDNAPVFASMPTDVNVEESATVGYELATVTASDADAGVNGVVDVYLISNTSLFAYNATTRQLTVAMLLVGHTGQHELVLRAVDRGVPVPQSTDLTVTATVVARNKFPPTFKQHRYTYDVLEDAVVGTFLGRMEAVDNDSGSAVQYKVSEEMLVPFAVEATTGRVSTTATLDRETTANYTFRVLAIDNGAPPTGPKTATAEVIVKVGDINDNAPSFLSEQYTESVGEISPIGTEVMRTKAFDADTGDNGDIASFSLHPPSAPFTVTVDGEFVIIKTTQVLDTETTDHYDLHLVAVDKGTPPMTSSVLVRVDVMDVNDNPPLLSATNLEIYLPRGTATNSLVATISASDADFSKEFSQVSYSVTFVSAPNVVAINRDTGALRLLSSLSSVSSEMVNVTVRVSDGLHEQIAHIAIHIVDRNIYAPTFTNAPYVLSLKESTAVGTTVLQVSAEDGDSSVLSFSVVSGNTGNVFSLKPLSGELVLLSGLDRRTTPSYELVIAVSDGGIDGADVLSATTAVNITVLEVNEFSPLFDNGAVFQAVVVEETTRDNIVKVTASDEDGDVITYYVGSDDDHFALNSSTGQIDLIKSLDRETVQEVRLEVWANDNGTPAKSSSAEVFITVTNINDNAPKFGKEAYSIFLNESTAVGGTVLHINASDADSPVLTFSITSGNTADTFSLKPLSGELILRSVLDRETTPNYALVIEVSDGGIDGRNVLSASATVDITIVGADMSSPQFDKGIYKINVAEETTRANIVTVSASTGGDDIITYTFVTVDDHFAINSTTGQVDLVKSLDRELVQEVRLQVLATVKGKPAKSAMVEVLVTVMDINDHSPVFAGKKVTLVQVTTIEFARGMSVYRAEAADADSGDNGDVRYSLAEVRLIPRRAHPDAFTVDEVSGVVRSSGAPVSRLYSVTIVAKDRGQPPRSTYMYLIVKVCRHPGSGWFCVL